LSFMPPEPPDEESRPDRPFPGELMIWLSPAFPTGAFAYSQGLETAAAEGLVRGRESLIGWLSPVIRHGALRNDLVFLSLAYRAADDEKLRHVAQLSAAMQPSAERAQEAAALGENFHNAVRAGWPQTDQAFSRLGAINPTLPVAVAIAANACDLPLAPTLEGFAHAYIANQISAAIRLSVVGQFDGQRVQAALFDEARAVAQWAQTAGEDDLGGATFLADLKSMQHETLKVRLFRS